MRVDHKKIQNQFGFTIVELLIVNVVVAILAAITIVAYSGFQTRAENNKTIQAVNQYLRAITLYASEKSAYLVSPNACLGLYNSNARCGNVGTGSCFLTSQAYQYNFSNTIKNYIGSELPSLSSQEIACQDTLVSGGYYFSTDGKSATILYVLKGLNSCPKLSTGTTVSSYKLGDALRCGVSLPDL